MPAKGYITIEKKLCKSCSYCVEACPQRLISIGDKINPAGYLFANYIDPDKKCTACVACALTCPEVAIDVYKW